MHKKAILGAKIPKQLQSQAIEETCFWNKNETDFYTKELRMNYHPDGQKQSHGHHVLQLL